MVHSKTSSTFKFGDGKECIANENVILPVVIGKNLYKLSVDVVDNELPLLISRKSMKSLGIKLNFERDLIEIENMKIPLYISSSGHYCIPLTPCDLDVKYSNIILHAANISGLSRIDKMKKALKLHRQFPHASKEKLIKLVKSSGMKENKEFFKCIEECCDTCDTCKMYKRPYHRPIVCLPIADRFNQVLCMDLKRVFT